MHSIRTRVLALATATALLTLALGAGPASADGGRAHRDAENTFTKYISSFPDMAGVVGGAVGDGAYAGEITTLTVTATGLVIDADYHFYGSIHTFSARVHIVQTGFADGSTAVITGRVTEGWLRDNLVAGQYTEVTCEQTPGVFGTCFHGTLDILRGTKPEG